MGLKNSNVYHHLLISLHMHYCFVHKKERIYLYRSKYGHWCIGKHCHCLCVCRCLCLCICTTETLLYKAQAREETDECHICGVVPETLGKRFSFPFPKSVFCTRLETGKDKKWNPVEKLRTGRGEVGALLPMQGNLAKKSNKINNQ